MVSRFGTWNFCTKKVKRQLYWLPKLKYTNKFIKLIFIFILKFIIFSYLDRRLVEGKELMDVELARIALKTMCRDAGTQITSFKVNYKSLLIIKK
jgi:hypothetical protein